jgi:uncharacterized repeat protein (TIGR03803 family)
MTSREYSPSAGSRSPATRWTVVLAIALALITASSAAQTYTVLHTFTGSDGYTNLGVMPDAAGNLYGNTPGVLNGPNYGYIFKIDPNGDFTTLHNFGKSIGDGTNPSTTLIVNGGGDLIGATGTGGQAGSGTIFSYSHTGNYKILYSFARNSSEFPDQLAIDRAGNIYGTSDTGGQFNWGTISRLDPRLRFKILHSFDLTDGGYPFGTLVVDKTGNIYGTTLIGGGSLNCNNGCGVVYQLDSAGTLSVLHAFTSMSDGWQPMSGLTQDSKGNLYGTTRNGGSDFDGGTIFEVTAQGKYKLLYRFTSQTSGSLPMAIISDGKGNLYGVAGAGGDFLHGAIFKFDSSGHLSLVYSFTGGADGNYPNGSLHFDSEGNLYGTTEAGGDLTCSPPTGCGVIFKLSF